MYLQKHEFYDYIESEAMGLNTGIVRDVDIRGYINRGTCNA